MTSPSRSCLKLPCPVCGMDFQQVNTQQIVCSRESCKRALVTMDGNFKRFVAWAVKRLVEAKRAA